MPVPFQRMAVKGEDHDEPNEDHDHDGKPPAKKTKKYIYVPLESRVNFEMPAARHAADLLIEGIKTYFFKLKGKANDDMVMKSAVAEMVKVTSLWASGWSRIAAAQPTLKTFGDISSTPSRSSSSAA